MVLVRLAVDPKDRDIAAKQVHKMQMEDAPPAADSPNALRRPMREGTEVSAGRRG